MIKSIKIIFLIYIVTFKITPAKLGMPEKYNTQYALS